MKVFSYTKSSVLLDLLNSIDEKRRSLLLITLSPQSKQQIRWNATVMRIFATLNIQGEAISKNSVATLLSPLGKKQLTVVENKVVKYKKALDQLYQSWLVNNQPVTVDHLENMYHILFDGKLKISKEELERHLKYLQIKPEHPAVQAALAYIVLVDLSPFTSGNDLFAHIVFLLFFYKQGYDFRGFLVIEEYFLSEKNNFREIIELTIRQENVTTWLEYVAVATLHQLEQTLKMIENESYNNVLAPGTLIDLNLRQKSILLLLEKPGETIGNKEVQKTFKISQITASRDLAKLVSLGLIIALGKGRSTYYSRV